MALTVASVVLIAATYGMARFGVGLLYPQMVRAQPGLEGGLRPAGTAQFASYCVAVLVGGHLSRSHARAVAWVAGLSAGTGCLGLLMAQSPLPFTAAAFVAGSGAGLASPALVPLLDRAVPTRWAGPAQAAVNSGTAIGLVLSGGLALATTSATTPWVMTAFVCVAAGSAVALLGPAAPPSPPRRQDAAGSPGLRPMVVPFTLAMGAGGVTAYIWTYGPSVIVQRSLFTSGDIGWLWLVVGLGGVLGLLTSQLVERIGPLGAFMLSAGGIGAATAGVVLTATPGVALLSLALFGACYMAMSSTLILWARDLQPSNSGQATAWLFLALALGQAMGAAMTSP
ncbi:MAG: MFS transporter [Ornithinimicrobium sp.]